VPAVQERFSDYLRSVIGNREHAGLLRGIRKDGEEVVWFYFNTLFVSPGMQPYIMGQAQDVTELVCGNDDRGDLIEKLQKALRQVKALTGMLPICSSCKNIRDDRGDWKQIERFSVKILRSSSAMPSVPSAQRHFIRRYRTECIRPVDEVKDVSVLYQRV